MLTRRKKKGGVSDGMDGQDSFLDIVSNIVGILIILVMIAGVRAQNSSDFLPTRFDDESVGVSATGLQKLPAESDEVVQYADESMIRELEEKLNEYKTKEREVENIRQTMINIQTTTDRISEQIQLQEGERDKLFGLVVDLRAEIEMRAEERGEEAKVQAELQRRISDADAKLEQIERTRKWIESGRPKAVRMENMPTPISKTVEEKEAHFRIKGGKIVYVPINELGESFFHEFNSNRNKFFSNNTTRGRVGPISDFVMDYLVVRYMSPMAGAAGNGVGQRVVLEMAAYTTKNNNAGTYYKDAITKTNSDFQRLVQQYRQDIYTITFWVYPDSFDAFCEVKQFLYAKGYRVAARPLNENDEIRASSKGTKSSAQ
ncbi:MAG: hypothetical protein LBT09_08925 [Planctomycetaceae bacterium]|jgi:predicted  nucleic acid-binding Zn-ribbon protein|nr:hypothetical protein [Planctomycetaceae bacterium]